MKTILAALLLFVSWMFVYAQQLIVFPTDDGSVYFNRTTRDNTDVVTSPSVYYNIEGDIHFAAFNASADPSIQLELNPYAEPLDGNYVYVYGFDNTTALLNGSDYNAGTFLGTWDVAGLGFGQETFFDVTSFVKSVTGPFFGFELQSDGPDVFSSSAENYGIPPELIVTTPEPSAIALLAVGLSALLLRRHKYPRPNKSPEFNPVVAVRSAIAFHVASRRWLSFLR
jgi:hypothetical protein